MKGQKCFLIKPKQGSWMDTDKCKQAEFDFVAMAQRVKAGSGSEIQQRENEDDEVYVLADIIDNPTLKSDVDSLDFPMFAMSSTTEGGHQIDLGNGLVAHRFFWESLDGRQTMEIITRHPAGERPTLADKNLVVYLISQMVSSMNRDGKIPRKIWVKKNKFLTTTGKRPNETSYNAIDVSLSRLANTRMTITTTDKAKNELRKTECGYIDTFSTVKYLDSGRMKVVEVVMSDFICEVIRKKRFLTISKEYFGLSPFEKRIYEIARKYCGNATGPVGFDEKKLLEKTGSNGSIRDFRRMLKKIIDRDSLPDYFVRSDGATVFFEKR